MLIKNIKEKAFTKSFKSIQCIWIHNLPYVLLHELWCNSLISIFRKYRNNPLLAYIAQYLQTNWSIASKALFCNLSHSQTVIYCDDKYVIIFGNCKNKICHEKKSVDQPKCIFRTLCKRMSADETQFECIFTNCFE